MRLVYEDSGAEVKAGDRIITASGYELEVVRFNAPPMSQVGMVQIEDIDRKTRLTSVKTIGAHWIERESQPCLF